MATFSNSRQMHFPFDIKMKIFCESLIEDSDTKVQNTGKLEPQTPHVLQRNRVNHLSSTFTDSTLLLTRVKGQPHWMFNYIKKLLVIIFM